MVNFAGKEPSYRLKQELIYKILMAARAPKTRTKILYESMISWEQCNEFLKELINEGLLKYDPFNSAYVTTVKGLKFIQQYEKLRDEIDGRSN